jgi:hypothetical protein
MDKGKFNGIFQKNNFNIIFTVEPCTFMIHSESIPTNALISLAI